MSERFLSHFTMFSYTDLYWSASQRDRERFQAEFLEGLGEASPRFDLYQVSPARTEADVLAWLNLEVSRPEETGRFFECLGRAINAQRRYIRPGLTLWGFTGPSSYSRGKSAQAIDPMATERKPYLVLYPFVKTVDWYRMSRDARQGMMNEHIRIGHQYPEITQLLLYSTGLQDQEFVVVYETDDLIQFSDLVVELRGSEARRFTERDTPIYTAFHHAPQATLALSGPGGGA
jgi:chlorite dismutase